ncbi:TBC1 domain family member 23 [Bradysia coprophila]|uniref:TBC1 domain family member 23 n=1 Tax=Bradysia coprophila TaxID=38358 RepID=UPI00187D7BD2|nr:TBC1 domain family member 23 [Bradysia coprophila]
MDDKLWLIELESALLDDCTVNDVYAICRGKAIPEALRPDVWQICLDVRHKSDQMALFNEIYDLPFQNKLRDDCDNFVDKLGNDDEDKVSVVSDLESILTFYCKNRNLQYETNNGWIELLLPLLSLKLSRSYTYNLFEAIRDTYIPKGCVKKGNVFHVFRLLILYHDPELCSMLDTKKITPDLYSMDWFQTLFAAKCTFPVVLSMWDLYFQQTDPFLVFFLGLIMLINARDQVLAMKNEPNETILEFLSNMPCALEPDDVVDFCSLSNYYSMKTPSSFKTDYLKSLFGSSHEVQPTDCIVSQALCLPVSVYELVENASMELTHQDAVRFFLVDCRPAEQYNVGHLSTAFHLDSNLMLQEPVAFATAIQGLLRAQKQAIEANSHAGGEHLCFMGSGRIEEDQYLYMAVASFLQKNTQYVSLLTGGYAAIHEYFGDHMADCLEDHDPFGCLVCKKDFIGMNAVENDVQLRNKPSSSGDAKQQRLSSDLFSKWSAAMKTKSAEVKDKLYEYIVNPSAPNPANNVERHVSSSDKNGRRYRNVAPVFSIDEENDEHVGNDEASQQAEENAKEVVTIQTYLQHADVIASFKCQEVHMNGYMYESHLIVTKTHLVVLRDLDKKGSAQVIVRRPLSSIVKITAKKRHRDLITFKYGVPDDDQLLITDMDRFLIPNASVATATISKHIVKQLDA